MNHVESWWIEFINSWPLWLLMWYSYFFLSALDLRDCDVDDSSQLRSVEFCCPLLPDYDCNKQRQQRLNHSVIKFFSKPLVITLPHSIFSTFAQLSRIWYEQCLLLWSILSWPDSCVLSDSLSQFEERRLVVKVGSRCKLKGLKQFNCFVVLW